MAFRKRYFYNLLMHVLLIVERNVCFLTMKKLKCITVVADRRCDATFIRVSIL